MEWVETTGKSLEEAKDRALDQLGVAADEAEFEIVEEPRSGLFGRVRGEARVRARVKPTAVRPKQDRRHRGRSKERAGGGRNQRGKGGRQQDGGASVVTDDVVTDDAATDEVAGDPSPAVPAAVAERSNAGAESDGADERPGSQSRRRSRSPKQEKASKPMDTNEDEGSDVTPDEVGAAAEEFMSGLASAFGADATTEVEVEGTEIDVRVSGPELGLLVGPGGRTLAAVQDLARVASQRKLGDHDTRLRVDVGGYREKRRAALEKFAHAVANQVIESGAPKALEPMSSADRKVVHDSLSEFDGVSSRSEGDEPMRRVVISPA